MSPPTRYLTKSRFKLGCECPTKLYYTGKSEYGNTNQDNAFLKALAEGGFQVGELAKLYHPGGIEILAKNTAEAIAQTELLLKSEKITLYEAAIPFGDLLVRADILVKNGNTVELIEVKAKSIDPTTDSFYNKNSLNSLVPKLSSRWEPYLLDVAFQHYVLQKAHPEWIITSALMLANKAAVATIDGLNQKIFLVKNPVDDRFHPEIAPGTREMDLGEKVLVKMSIDSEVAHLQLNGYEGRPFPDLVDTLAQAYKTDQMLPPPIGDRCKGCEFRIGPDQKAQGLKSGFDLCWKTAAGLSAEELNQPLVFDLWNFRKSEESIQNGKYFLKDLDEADFSPFGGGQGLSQSERQWLQVSKVVQNDPTPYLDAEGLRSEMARWKYPLHFIDFETTMVAIPFNKGRRPYEQIAFQFSHHVANADGSIEHRTEYFNRVRGKFPNFDFVRNLKQALSNDDGTIFRFAAHENTVLCQIYQQLENSSEPDRLELMAWIQTITHSKKGLLNAWQGPRDMVDMLDLVKNYFYHPLMGGSNSIKKVLPAVLRESYFFQELYSKPVYGAAGGVRSKNFKDWSWIRKDASGLVMDPYKLLPPIFTDLDLAGLGPVLTSGSIDEGGAAMIAYARMQFSQMGEGERELVASALLKYCELDTFAMVLIWAYWVSAVGGLALGARVA